MQTLHGDRCCRRTSSLRQLVQTQLKSSTVHAGLWLQLTLLPTNSISPPACRVSGNLLTASLSRFSIHVSLRSLCFSSSSSLLCLPVSPPELDISNGAVHYESRAPYHPNFNKTLTCPQCVWRLVYINLMTLRKKLILSVLVYTQWQCHWANNTGCSRDMLLYKGWLLQPKLNLEQEELQILIS